MSKNFISKKHQKQLMTIGLYLRELRFNSDVTQEELSHKSDIHRNSISNAEQGKNITLNTLMVLSEAYSISPAEVLSIIHMC